MRSVAIVVMSLGAVAVAVGFGTIVAFQLRTFDAHCLQPANGPETALKMAGFRLPKGYYYDGAHECATGASVYVRPIDTRYDGFMIRVQSSSLAFLGFSLGSDDDFVRIEALGGAPPCSRSEATETRADVMTTSSGTMLAVRAFGCRARGRAYTYEVARIPSTYPLAVLTASGPAASFDRAGLRALVATLP